MKHILAEEAQELLKNKQCHLLIDVRSPAEFKASHIEGAQNVPLDHLCENISDIIPDKNATLYLMCSCGNRSGKGCEEMAELGYENAISIEGGMIELKKLGVNVVEDQHKVMSIERQVRIVAGSLVLIGLVLGFLINPMWFGLSAFVGTGLVFAGITDTCGMGLLLAKMPWNQ
ncbi:MAG: rhodanese-like domain-containing protein [Hydrogenovibrio sp.]